MRRLLISFMVLMGCFACLGCEKERSDAEEAENTEVLCNDGIDNDGDQAIDCADGHCAPFCSNDTLGADTTVVVATDTEIVFDTLLDSMPVGASPDVIGRLLVENYIDRRVGAVALYYAHACTWYGALGVASLLEEQALLDSLISRFDPVFTPEGEDIVPTGAHVDDRVFGIVPLELWLHTQDSRYMELGKGLADAQWGQEDENGITTEARYWIDDMYMITSLQVQAYRATQDAIYLDRAAKTMVSYLDELQQPTGLFFHTALSPVYWSRGNGWVASGLTELMRDLPEDHPNYVRVYEGYSNMMAALLQHQSQNGLWRQIIDDPEAWEEMSGSAMFAFAMVSGVKNGWLDEETYAAPARNAWISLVGNLTATGNLREVCVGTGEAYNSVGDDAEAQRQYYLDRPRQSGDYHGQAPMLWTAAALMR